MKWHVLTKHGATDPFRLHVPSADGRIWAAFDSPTDPSRVGNDVARRVLYVSGIDLSELILDLLQVAMSIHTADLRIPRRFSDDGWARDITVHLPVHDLPRWTGAANSLVSTLTFLTGDTWAFDFRTRPARAAGPTRQLRIGS